MLPQPQLPVIEGILQGQAQLVLILQSHKLWLHIHLSHRVSASPLANLHTAVGVAWETELVPDPTGHLPHTVPLHLEVILQLDWRHRNPHGPGVGRHPAPGGS